MLMKPRTIDRRQVRQHFSNHAGEYDRYARVQKLVAERLTRLVAGQNRTWDRALEVGCGTGLLSRKLVQQIPGIRLVLSDLAHGMSRSVVGQFEDPLICDADAADLPFASKSFDLLLSSSVYQWIEDLPAAFAEAGRVLKPGGLLALSLFGEKTLYELKDSYKQAESGQASHVQRFYSLDGVLAGLGEQFELQWSTSQMEVEWHPNVAELLRSLKRIGAQNANPQKPAGLASKRQMLRMMDIYQEQYGTSQGIPATYEVLSLLARKV